MFCIAILLAFLFATVSADEQHNICGTYRFFDETRRLASLWGTGREAWDRAGVDTPRDRYEVGDQRSFYSSIGSRHLLATLQVKGENCYIWAEDALWGSTILPEQLALVRTIFDDSTAADPSRGSYEIDVEAFGAPPDIDNDNRIHILVLNIAEGGVGGYFWPGNEYPSSAVPNSNELDMFYYDDELYPWSSDFAAAVPAHEFQHMINWGHDSNEELWLNEGLSGLGEFLSGYVNAGGWAATWAQFTDRSLTEWEPSHGDYFGTAIFCIYMYEKFGETLFTRTLLDEPQNGRIGIENVLGELGYDMDFRQLFKNWSLAILLDNPDMDFYGGVYGYETVNLPVGPGMAHVHTDYPVDPVAESAENWGVDYIRLQDGGLMQWGATAQTGTSRRLEVEEILNSFSAGNPIVFDRGIVDGTLLIDLAGFGGEWETVVLAICNTSANLLVNYEEFTQVHPMEPPPLPGWPLQELGILSSSPVVVDGLVGIADKGGTLHLLTADGSDLAGWPVHLDDEIWATPTLADLENDGSLEIVVGTVAGEVHVFTEEGQPKSGWPNTLQPSTYGIPGSVTVFDLDGDSYSEIIATSFSGEIGCWTTDGTPYPGMARPPRNSSVCRSCGRRREPGWVPRDRRRFHG